MNKLITMILLCPLLSFGQVSDTNTFTLQDVISYIGLPVGVGTSLQDCFDIACVNGFDLDYKGSADRLGNFRNYESPSAFSLRISALSIFLTTSQSVMTDISFNNEGSIMYLSGDDNFIYQYTLSAAFDLSTASYASKSVDTSSLTSTFSIRISIVDSGTKLFISAEYLVMAVVLSTPYDISTTSTFLGQIDTDPQVVDEIVDFQVSPDGSHLYVTDGGNTYDYDMGTSFDITTASYSGDAEDFSTGVITAFQIISDGLSVYTTSVSKFEELSMSPAFDITSSSLTGDEIEPFIHPEATNGGLFVTNDGVNFFVIVGNYIYQYSNDCN